MIGIANAFNLQLLLGGDSVSNNLKAAYIQQSVERLNEA